MTKELQFERAMKRLISILWNHYGELEQEERFALQAAELLLAMMELDKDMYKEKTVLRILTN